jgi:hypothetical protein
MTLVRVTVTQLYWTTPLLWMMTSYCWVGQSEAARLQTTTASGILQTTTVSGILQTTTASGILQTTTASGKQRSLSSKLSFIKGTHAQEGETSGMIKSVPS